MIAKISAVEKHREMIFSAQNYIWANPETGYREKKTSKYMEDAFERLGYELIISKIVQPKCGLIRKDILFKENII